MILDYKNFAFTPLFSKINEILANLGLKPMIIR